MISFFDGIETVVRKGEIVPQCLIMKSFFQFLDGKIGIVC